MVNVLYEDNHIIAVLKPAGIPVEKGRRNVYLAGQVKDYLKNKYKKPGNVFLGIVHRLDQPVSGIVLFGKTSKGASRLSEQFRERELEKVYRAVLVGKLKRKKGILKSRIKKEGGNYFRATTDPKGKEAELEYRIVKEGEFNSLAEIRLGTGRFHQIRAQFAAIGHPIMGDAKYGSPTVLPEGKIALHSTKLTFMAATGERKVELVSSEPEYFKELL
ncbi:MAG: RNA pseudouridine synthase [Parcubacteria group bacterium]